MWVFLYKIDTKEFWGASRTPEQNPDCDHTDIAPPAYDELVEQIYFVDGAWEKRTI